jgi:hypothetical protein
MEVRKERGIEEGGKGGRRLEGKGDRGMEGKGIED